MIKENIVHLNSWELNKYAVEYVACQLINKGANLIQLKNHRGKNYIFSKNKDNTSLTIIVKSRRKGNWHTSIDYGKLSQEPDIEYNFWIFVDFKPNESGPDYYIVPDWWIRNSIYENHQAYLKKHGGKRPINPNSKHHSVLTQHINQWKDRWDILKL